MFTKTLATALVSGLLLTGAMGGSSYAMEGGGGGGDGGNFAWAQARNPDGSTITSRSNGDGTRTVITRDRNGKVVKKEKVGGKKAAAKKPKPRSRPWASAYDPNTGTRTTSIGNGDGTRTVITVSPFGFGIGISR